MKPKGKILIALLLVISLLAVNCVTLKMFKKKREQIKHDVEFIIQKKDSQKIIGDLIIFDIYCFFLI